MLRCARLVLSMFTILYCLLVWSAMVKWFNTLDCYLPGPHCTHISIMKAELVAVVQMDVPEPSSGRVYCRLIQCDICCYLCYCYRVAQNKPDYLLLLFQFCISSIKHTSMMMIVCSTCPPPGCLLAVNEFVNNDSLVSILLTYEVRPRSTAIVLSVK